MMINFTKGIEFNFEIINLNLAFEADWIFKFVIKEVQERLKNV